MTAKELAEMLDRREAGMEITSEEAWDARCAGLVAVYGYSDDNVEFSGAIRDEVSAWEGADVYLSKEGIMNEPDCGCWDCPYFDREREKARTIKAVWHDEGGPCWTFETDIPHETFNIYEDGELFCVGIVFSAEDL